MFDHHSVVYEMASGPRIYALCQTRADASKVGTTSSWARKASATGPTAASKGKRLGAIDGPRNVSHIEEQNILISAIREGRLVNHGDTMVDSTYMAIMGQVACYNGQPVTWEQITKSEFEFEPKLADVRLDGPAPTQPDPQGNYPLPIPGMTDFL